MGIIEYSSNNSGGGWWLDDADWKALENAGWVVHWVHDVKDPSHTHNERVGAPSLPHTHAYGDHKLTPVTSSGERWLGALATSAAKETDDPDAAIREFESATGQNSSDEGCNCCGAPHSFTYTDDNGDSHYSYVEVVRTRMGWS